MNQAHTIIVDDKSYNLSDFPEEHLPLLDAWFKSVEMTATRKNDIAETDNRIKELEAELAEETGKNKVSKAELAVIQAGSNAILSTVRGIIKTLKPNV